jgi:hypothetical protein
MRNTFKRENIDSKKMPLSEKDYLPYYVIVLNESRIRLLEGRDMQVTETDNKFLQKLEENKFQSHLKEIQAELKKAEKKIRASIQNIDVPVIICGENKILNAYKEISQTHYSMPYYFELNLDRSSLAEIGLFAGRMAKQIYCSK